MSRTKQDFTSEALATSLANALVEQLGSKWSPLVQQVSDPHYKYGASLKGSIAGASFEIIAVDQGDGVFYVGTLWAEPFKIIIHDDDPVKVISDAKEALDKKVQEANKSQEYFSILLA